VKISGTLSIAAALLATSGAQAQHIGAKYQSRDPHSCASRTAPAKGPISAAQAKQYFVCDAEGESASSVSDSTLHLVTGVSVQVGAGRPFLMGTDDTGDNTDEGIDPHYTVYPIRGSFVDWSCKPVGEFNPAGRNCMRQAMPRATGICFMSSFREWHCNMQDITQPSQNYQPPPKGD
jgi:hypothetical protein